MASPSELVVDKAKADSFFLPYFDRFAPSGIEPAWTDMEAACDAFAREVAVAVWVIEAYLREHVPGLELQCAVMLDDPQLHRVWRNFVWEASREALEERRRMLAYALAGTFDPRLSVEQKARAERALRLLDPIDVRTLFGVDRVVGSRDVSGAVHGSEGQLRHWVWQQAEDPDVIVTSGCLQTVLTGVGAQREAHVAPLGRIVLQVLRMFLLDQGAPFPVPGRHPEPDDEARGSAWEVFRRIPGLLDLVFWAANQPRIRWEYRPTWPPNHEATVDDALGELALFYPYDGKDMGKTVQDRIAAIESNLIQVRLQLHPDRDLGSAIFVAPHRALRILAEHVEAPWIAPDQRP